MFSAATRVVMHQIVMPSEVDSLGICFGGQVLSWIDVCAGLSAKSLARGPCVTASVDAVHFLKPCRQGMVVIIAAMVNRTFSSSMELGVRVEAEDMRTGIRHHCCSAYLTFVSVAAKSKDTNGTQGPATPLPRVLPSGREHDRIFEDADSRPQRCPYPRVLPNGREHDRIFEDADSRRIARLERRAKLRGDPELAKRLELCRDGGPTLPCPMKIDPQGGESRTQVAPELTTAYMTQSIMPQDANTLNITFVTGSPGTSRVTGSPGTSRVTGSPASSRVTGSPGSSRVTGSPASSRVTGSPASSRVTGSPASSRVTGSPASSRVTGSPASSRVTGSPGSSIVTGSPGSSRVTGSPGSSRVTVTGSPASSRVTGSPASSRVTGSPASSRVTGSPASSRVTGSPASSRVTGSPASSRVTGSPASSRVTGSAGSSRVTGSPASSRVTGSPASSRVTGSPGSSRVNRLSRLL
eukprot:gene24461-10061_t